MPIRYVTLRLPVSKQASSSGGSSSSMLVLVGTIDSKLKSTRTFNIHLLTYYKARQLT